MTLQTVLVERISHIGTSTGAGAEAEAAAVAREQKRRILLTTGWGIAARALLSPQQRLGCSVAGAVIFLEFNEILTAELQSIKQNVTVRRTREWIQECSDPLGASPRMGPRLYASGG